MIGQRIKEVRKSRGLTQEQLAEKVGITRTALGKIENSRVVNMSAFTAINIARALRVSLDFLLCNECLDNETHENVC